MRAPLQLLLLASLLPAAGCAPIVAGVILGTSSGGGGGSSGGSAPPPGTTPPAPVPTPTPSPSPTPPPIPPPGGGSGSNPPPVLNQPQRPTITVQGPNAVQLSWNDSARGESGYVVERIVAPNVWAPVASTVADVTTVVDTTALSNRQTEYRVRAVGNGAQGTPSDTITVQTPAHFVVVNEDQRRVYLLPSDDLGNPRLLGVARGHRARPVVGVTPRFNHRGPTESIELYESAHDHASVFSLSRGKILKDVSFDQGFEEARSGFARRWHGLDGTLAGVFGGNSLRLIDSDTGTTTSVGALIGPVGTEVVKAVGFGGVSLFAAVSADGDQQAERLYLVSLADGGMGPGSRGAFGIVNDIQSLCGTRIDDDLFGTDGAPGVVSKLYRINHTTGAATELGSTGVTNVVGIAAVSLPHPDAPRVSRAVPQFLPTDTATTVTFYGANLTGATVSSLHTGVTVLSSYTSAQGHAIVATLRTAPSVHTGVPIRVDGNGRGSLYVLDVLDTSQPLVVGNGSTVELAGTVRLPSLTIEAGGTLRGVGLAPVRLVVDGAVVIRGTLDVSGADAGPLDESGSPPFGTRLLLSGDGGPAGPGGGGGGGGGPTERTNNTGGGWGGDGLTGGGGGGSSPTLPAAAGGLGLGTSGANGTVGAGAAYGFGGAGGRDRPSGATGGTAAQGGGGGGGTGSPLGLGGPGGTLTGTTGPTGQGGGGGAWHSSNGVSGGGGGYGTAGNPGRRSGGSSTGGGPGGLAHGDVQISLLAGGSGGGGGSGRGAFEGIGGGGGGGGGAIAIIATHVEVGATGVVRAKGGDNVVSRLHDGEGGGGSGGAIVLHAPTVDLKTGASITAVGGVAVGHGSVGQGGVGRIRIDAITYRQNGLDVAAATVAALTNPVAFTGATAPVLTLPNPPVASGDLVELTVRPDDGDASQVRLAVEFTTNDGATWQAARASLTHDPLHGLVGIVGYPATYRWDPRRDLSASTYTIKLRVRLIDARASAWVESTALAITVN